MSGFNNNKLNKKIEDILETYVSNIKRYYSSNCVYSIQHFRLRVFKDELLYFLFIHSIVGCDTTSAIFQLGKFKYLKIVQANLQINDSLLIQYDESLLRSYCMQEKYTC